MPNANGNGDTYFARTLDEYLAVGAQVRRELGGAFQRMLNVWCACISNGGKIIFFGNGGSASQAQHFAAELVVRMHEERAAIPAISLTVDTSSITAAGNDFGFDRIFSRQIEALGRPGDVAVGISTSGNSRNIITALEVARARGLTAAGLSGGDGGQLARIADPVIVVPSPNTARIQEIHLVLGHMLCAELERAVRLD